MTKTMNHKEYPKSLKHKTDAELRYIIKDATEAAEANKENPNNGFYLDEVHYAAAELRKRN
jgi:hypothetical protein